MELDLTPFFKTKAQATDFIARLAGISAKVYETNFNLEEALLDEFGIQRKDKFMALLRNNKINTESAANLKTFLNKVQDTTKTLPVLSLTLAFEPKDKTLKALAEWFTMNLKKQMLFDITVDQDIIGGASVNYKGKFVDASIKPVFEKVLKELLPTIAGKEEKHPEQQSQQQQQPVAAA